VLLGIWLGLARQLSVVWGLGHAVRPTVMTSAEHFALLDSLARGDREAAERQLAAHLSWHNDLDFEAEIEARRLARGKR